MIQELLGERFDESYEFEGFEEEEEEEEEDTWWSRKPSI